MKYVHDKSANALTKLGPINTIEISDGFGIVAWRHSMLAETLVPGSAPRSETLVATFDANDYDELEGRDIFWQTYLPNGAEIHEDEFLQIAARYMSQSPDNPAIGPQTE